MKVLNYLELEQIVEVMQEFVGSELQGFSQSKSQFALKHWDGEKLLTLLGDLSAAKPIVIPFLDKPPVSLKAEKKPLTLFFSANVKGARLEKVYLKPELGRVLFLGYVLDERSIEIEIRCLPHSANLIVKAPEKQMSWFKPKQIEAREPQDLSHLSVRSLPTLVEEWLEKGSKQSPKASKENQKEKLIKKTEKLLKKLKSQLEEQTENPWDQKIEFFVNNQGSIDGKDLIDPMLDYAQNLQLAYEKQARWVEKRQSLKNRISEVEAELKQYSSEDWKPVVAQKKITEKLKDATKWRTKHFEDGLVGYIGKSGSDNLKILRKARAWDYWFHIKDQPGSFGILQRNKGQKIPEGLLRDMALWVAEQSFKGKEGLQKGLAFEVLVAECRYVKPIKGDKMGRVNYSNSRTLSVK